MYHYGDESMDFLENTKAYLVSIGYDESDFKQIEDAMSQSTFAADVQFESQIWEQMEAEKEEQEELEL